MVKTGERLKDLLSDNHKSIVLLHNTDSLIKAKNILNNGFKFENQLTYSTDRVNPLDAVEINYFLVERKEYGDFTIIIEINKKIIEQYSALAESANITIEEILTIEEPVLSENDEYVYNISNYYIKAIFNNKTSEVHINPVFDSMFDSPGYLENYNRLSR